MHRVAKQVSDGDLALSLQFDADLFDAAYVSLWTYDPATQRLRRALAHGGPDDVAALRDLGDRRVRNLSILAVVVVVFGIYAIATDGKKLFVQRVIDGVGGRLCRGHRWHDQ